MRTVWSLASLCLLMAPVAVAQAPTVEAGSAVRVYAPGVRPNRIYGLVEARGRDTILVRLRGGGDTASLALPISAVRQVWVQQGTRRQTGEGALVGLLVGTAAGAAIGAAADAGCSWVCVGPLVGVIIGAPAGLIVGGVVGSFFEAPRWVGVRLTF